MKIQRFGERANLGDEVFRRVNTSHDVFSEGLPKRNPLSCTGRTPLGFAA
jgi:hypothetical protein